MKKLIVGLYAALCVAVALAANRRVPSGCDATVMSDAYWKIWNAETQAKLDRDIARNRMADAEVEIGGVTNGTVVTVEQLSHGFRFGAHAFFLGRQRTEELNRRYEENFVRLFNQATIAFYWRSFETAPGDLHFHTRPGDLESAFTSGAREAMDARSRYLSSPDRSTDQFLEFAKSHGLIVHGHPLVWGSEEWMIPFWLYDQYCPDEEKAFLRLPRKDPRAETRLFAEWDWINAYRSRIRELFARYSEEEIAAKCPVYLANMKRLYARRIQEILEYCGDRVDSWDVVNESSPDWANACGRSCENAKPLVKSCYGILPPNYTLESFRTAAKYASSRAALSINDWNMAGADYHDQIADLLKHGARIDMVGSQFHIFGDGDFRKVVAGGSYNGLSEPDAIERLFARLGQFGKPVNLSEITIPAPGDTPAAQQQQAIVAANLYRAWFAQPSCCGITWWHTLDGADANGGIENGSGGVMDAEANPKLVYRALYDLIHCEWKTDLKVKVDNQGKVRFRGFRGRYRLTWTDSSGQVREEPFVLR